MPPHVDGIMELSTADTAAIKAKLDAIIAAFAPTDETPVCDTFYITAMYNRANVGKEINGDTAQSILAGE